MHYLINNCYQHDMDSYEHIAIPQSLTIPFQVLSRGPCTVSIHIEPDSDPVKNGQDLLGLWPDPNIVLGFPVVSAKVSSPVSRSYAAIYGWVQITYTPGEDWVMDLYPPFQDVNSPFACWGAEPQLVDVPGRDLTKPEWKDREYDWTARSFLCYSPDAGMTKTVVPILVFEWGFWLKDGKVFVKKLSEIDVGVWNGHLGMFRKNFKGWEFREAPEKDKTSA